MSLLLEELKIASGSENNPFLEACCFYRVKIQLYSVESSSL